jgi:CubicO group peptidase (beta-lactamase class C family)
MTLKVKRSCRITKLAACVAAFLLPFSCQKTLKPDFSSAMDSFCREHGFNGSILVAERGEIVFSGAYGYADFEAGIANAVDTPFKIASVTMQFTAACVLLLRERGLIDLEDPVSKFVPEYPNGDSIRIRHLLSHTSGIAEYTTVAFLGRADRGFTPEELIRHFRDKPLKFRPGTRFEYSNSNYVLLGAVIEIVSGMSYGDFLSQNILAPLGMENTFYRSGRPAAKGYLRLESSAGIAAFPLDLSARYASGGIVSTVEDLFVWDRALYGKGILRKKSIDLMFSRSSEFSDYGFGWRIEKSGRRPIVFHSGSINGGAGMIYRDTRRDRVIIILSNVQNADLASIREKALEEFER